MLRERERERESVAGVGDGQRPEPEGGEGRGGEGRIVAAREGAELPCQGRRGRRQPTSWA